MNTFTRSFGWSEYSLLISYHVIDYHIWLSDWYITIRWSCWGGLMEQSMDWMMVKQILTDIVQDTLISKEIKQPRFKNNPVILFDEHWDPGTEWYILFERLAGLSYALKIRIRNLANKQLIYDQTIILCPPQRDLFENTNLIETQVFPLVFATKSDIDHILILMWAVDKVQSKYYPDFEI